MQKEIGDTWSSDDINNFCEQLMKTGEFDELEIKVLKAMLFLELRKQQENVIPKFTANMVAEKVGMSDTNAYKYLYSLQRKGLVESTTTKNKLFWLTHSSNPMPRVFDYITRKYLEKKKLFSDLEETYGKLVKLGSIWGEEKAYEQYKGNFADRAAFLFDAAQKEILITTDKFFDDIALLDAVKRAVVRGVKIRIISGEIHPDTLRGLQKINIELRLGKVFPNLILVDEKHGMTMDQNEEGIWFLNMSTDYRDKFEDHWDKADII